MLYSYQARHSDGVSYEGTHEALGKAELYAFIREEGGSLISVKEVKSKALSGDILPGLFTGVKTHDKIIFARNLSSMIEAGLSVTRALGVMEKQSKKKTLKKLFSDLSDDVSKGIPLSEALKKHPKVFSGLFISMVKAGEESGNLASALKIVAGQMEKTYLLVKKVKGALIYPGVIMGVMVVIAALMLIYMVPTLTATFEGVGMELPLSTRIIIASSDFLIEHTIIFLGGVVALIVSLFLFLKSTVGKKVMDHVTVKLPAIGNIIKESNSARTARTLASLLSSGVAIVTAIDVTKEIIQNSLYKKVLDEARIAVEKGDSMSAVFMKYDKLYPTFVGEMISVGEETGKISEMLLGVATYYENEVEEKTKDLSTIIEPVLMIFIGIGVGIFAISMLAPTYSLVENI